jgi:hypothetical protein
VREGEGKRRGEGRMKVNLPRMWEEAHGSALGKRARWQLVE